MRTVDVTLRITYDDSMDNSPRDWRWAEILECHPDDVRVIGVADATVTPIPDPGPPPLSMDPGTYAVEIYRCGNTGDVPDHEGLFRILPCGLVQLDTDASGWETQRFGAHGETLESIGKMLVDAAVQRQDLGALEAGDRIAVVGVHAWDLP